MNYAKELAYYNYYPFGMQMPGRYGTANMVGKGGYRYGFNGKEKDDDFGGTTSAVYDYGFRIYDSRIGKFLSVDPLTKEYPWYTPYQFAGNTPIEAIDVDGLEPAGINSSNGMNTTANDQQNTNPTSFNGNSDFTHPTQQAAANQTEAEINQFSIAYYNFLHRHDNDVIKPYNFVQKHKEYVQSIMVKNPSKQVPHKIHQRQKEAQFGTLKTNQGAGLIGRNLLEIIKKDRSIINRVRTYIYMMLKANNS